MATANRGNKRHCERLGALLGEYDASALLNNGDKESGKIHKGRGRRVLEERGAKILCQKDKMIAEKLSWKDLLKNDLENHPAWLLNYGFCHLSAPVFVWREEKNSLFDRDNHPKGFTEFFLFSRWGVGVALFPWICACCVFFRMSCPSKFFLPTHLELQTSLGQCSTHFFYFIFFFKESLEMCIKYSVVDQINLLPLWNYNFQSNHNLSSLNFSQVSSLLLFLLNNTVFSNLTYLPGNYLNKNVKICLFLLEEGK